MWTFLPLASDRLFLRMIRRPNADTGVTEGHGRAHVEADQDRGDRFSASCTLCRSSIVDHNSEHMHEPQENLCFFGR